MFSTKAVEKHLLYPIDRMDVMIINCIYIQLVKHENLQFEEYKLQMSRVQSFEYHNQCELYIRSSVFVFIEII